MATNKTRLKNVKRTKRRGEGVKKRTLKRSEKAVFGTTRRGKGVKRSKKAVFWKRKRLKTSLVLNNISLPHLGLEPRKKKTLC